MLERVFIREREYLNNYIMEGLYKEWIYLNSMQNTGLARKKAYLNSVVKKEERTY